MCGIFAYIGDSYQEEVLLESFFSIQHRGPDYSEFKQIKNDLFFGFHRLAINGLDQISNQPMQIGNCTLIANAEIFNYKELVEKYNLQLKSHSDCEVILHLYQLLGISDCLKELDGEYAFVIYDRDKNEIFAARDHLGVRGMYIGYARAGKEVFFASEAKALIHCEQLQQFPTGSWWSSQSPEQFIRYFEFKFERHDIQNEQEICDQIKYHVESAVKKRLMSERPVGALLSGGLDSSLVSAIAAKYYDRELETFSIGMPGSPDLAAAKKVAEHIGSKHHAVEVSEQDFLDALEETIRICGSFDVTTIRASVGHILISKYVRDHSDVKVLFTGETIDEMGSYLYFQEAPDSESFQEECTRLLEDIHYFDMLRGDRSISSAGLEARVPFSDRAFVRFFMGIDPKLRMFDNERIEKYLLRKAFENDGLLPDEILWRRKNGFSDSVSKKEKSWSTLIQEKIDVLISDQEFNVEAPKFIHDTPKTKEAYYYRKKFHEFYGSHELTPYQWLPKWCGDVVDPSARILKIYAAD